MRRNCGCWVWLLPRAGVDPGEDCAQVEPTFITDAGAGVGRSLGALCSLLRLTDRVDVVFQRGIRAVGDGRDRACR